MNASFEMVFNQEVFDREVSNALSRSGFDFVASWQDVMHVYQTCQEVQGQLSRHLHDKEAQNIRAEQDDYVVGYGDYAYVVAHYLLICSCFAMLAIMALRLIWLAMSLQSGTLAQVHNSLFGVIRKLQNYRTLQSQQEADLDAGVKTKLRVHLVQRFVRACKIFLPLTTVLLCAHIGILLPSSRDLPEWNNDQHARMARNTILHSSLILRFTCFSSMMITALFEKPVTGRYVDVVYILLALAVLHSDALMKESRVSFQNESMILLRCALAVIHGERKLAVISNGLHTLIMVGVVYQWEQNQVLRQCIGLLIICAISYLAQQSRQIEARAAEEIKQSRTVETAVDKLLSSMCDAVIQTNDTFDLIKPCPKFGSLLLRSSQPGNFFQTLWKDVDSEAFLAYIARDTSHAHSLHVSLRDANSSGVKVQLFHVGYQAFGERTQHLIGIREDSEIEGFVRIRTCEQQEQNFPTSQFGRASDDFTETSGDSSSLRSLRPITLVSDVHGLVVWVNACDRRLTMVKCTAEFTSVVGPSSSGLVHQIQKEVRAPFVGWLQNCVQDMEPVTKSKAASGSENFLCRVCLKSSSTATSTPMCYNVVCESLEEVSWDDNVAIVRLSFCKIANDKAEVSASL